MHVTSSALPDSPIIPFPVLQHTYGQTRWNINHHSLSEQRNSFTKLIRDVDYFSLSCKKLETVHCILEVPTKQFSINQHLLTNQICEFVNALLKQVLKLLQLQIIYYKELSKKFGWASQPRLWLGRLDSSTFPGNCVQVWVIAFLLWWL